MYRDIKLSAKSSGTRVLPYFSDPAVDGKGGSPRTRSLDAGLVSTAMRGLGLPTEAGAVLALDGGRLALCLGPTDGFTPIRMRTIGAKLGRALVKFGITSATIEGTSDLGRDTDERRAYGAALGEGLAIGTWRFDLLDGKASRREARLGTLTLAVADRAMREGLEHGACIADGVNLARRVAATPPNIATPAWIAKEAKGIARGTRIKVRVIDYRQAHRLGMGGLVAVGQGSAQKPCLVIMEWQPRRAKRADHVVLVGKTITYDTGGYSLKVNNGMKGMKYDKCGGAAVLGVMQTVAALDLPIKVTAVLAVAENMVSDDSYRPDDIITMHNGVTVEVTNTDAEGRLVLADALSHACATLKPTAIVDIATLTGGVGVALGNFCAGYFCEDSGLRQTMEQAASESGELVWRLPLWEAHRDFMRSQHADLINSNPLRSAHPIQGAAFLSFFVDSKIPWAHLDIASMAAGDAPNDLTGTGPTGYGVRLLVELLAQRSVKK